MSRNKGLAVLQKTYDDTYLKCSTAVYYESQGNEYDAMRCWKNALEEIYEHHASKVLPNYNPTSETDKALIDSLRQLELQCKERIDLLEALRASRQDSTPFTDFDSTAKSNMDSYESTAPTTYTPDKGWIAQGTIPAVTYPELSRPALPKRPSLPDRSSSERAVVSGRSSSSVNPLSPILPTNHSTSVNSPATLSVKPDLPARTSPSPDKQQRTMRTTLRNNKPGERGAKLTRKSAKPEGPGASKAATLAWSSLTSRERSLKGLGSSSEASASQSGILRPGDHTTPTSNSPPLQWDTHTRRLVTPRDAEAIDQEARRGGRHSDEYPYARPSALSVSAASSALNSGPAQETSQVELSKPRQDRSARGQHSPLNVSRARPQRIEPPDMIATDDSYERRKSTSDANVRRKGLGDISSRSNNITSGSEQDKPKRSVKKASRRPRAESPESESSGDAVRRSNEVARRRAKGKRKEDAIVADAHGASDHEPAEDGDSDTNMAWKKRKRAILKHLPPGVDESAAKQILNEVVVQGDQVHWGDVAGLEVAKNALREAVVYPFLRPDLFMGLREPARGMLLFGPPGTGKTMLARAVATESRSTFFSISASSLTSKFLGESEKLVRALFSLAKELAPSIIFVDEIDSLLSQRSGSGEHEATRRIKTEFLIQWSDLQRAAAGRAPNDDEKDRGDPNRVLVLAATNLPWAIDEAARRRFVRRQYIPLPEPETRSTQLRTLLGQQKHNLSDTDVEKLVRMTDGFSGSDITSLAKDAAMGPLRSLGEALLHMTMEEIRPIHLADFEASLTTIRPSVSKAGLKEYEDWAKEFGERAG